MVLPMSQLPLGGNLAGLALHEVLEVEAVRPVDVGRGVHGQALDLIGGRALLVMIMVLVVVVGVMVVEVALVVLVVVRSVRRLLGGHGAGGFLSVRTVPLGARGTTD